MTSSYGCRIPAPGVKRTPRSLDVFGVSKREERLALDIEVSLPSTVIWPLSLSKLHIAGIGSIGGRSLCEASRVVTQTRSREILV